MTPEERLAELLDQKDEQIAELEDQISALKCTQEWGNMRHSTNKEDCSPDLPCPRLEMRYEPDEKFGWTETTVTYAMVHRHFLGHYVTVPLGVTTIRSGRQSAPIYDGKISLPFRDGAHIKHDMAQLNLPAYAICEGQLYDLSVDANAC